MTWAEGREGGPGDLRGGARRRSGMIVGRVGACGCPELAVSLTWRFVSGWGPA